MWCSDNYDLPTGYTNQSNYITNYLAQWNHIIYYGHQYMGAEKLIANNMMYIPGGGGGAGNVGEPLFPFFIQKYHPQLVAWLCDAFMLPWAGKRKKEFLQTNPDLKYLFYCPLDSEDIYNGFEEFVREVDYLVTISEFGRRFIKEKIGLEPFHIPHCVDTNIFKPLPKEEIEKFKEQNGLKDKFIVGQTGRNQSRKIPAKLIDIFARFAKDKDDVVLMMHCDPYDPQGNNLEEYAKQRGVFDKLRFTGMRHFSGLPQEVMNRIYNIMDVHCLTTTGEGFGITTIEAMACGVPTVATDYTSTRELIIDGGECGIPVRYNNFIPGGYNTKRVLVDDDAYLEALNTLYYDKEKRKRMGYNGKIKVDQKYSNDVVLPQWKNLMDEIFAESFEIELVS